MALAEDDPHTTPDTGAVRQARAARPWARPLAVGAVAACGCAAIALANPGDDGLPLCWSQGVFGVDCPLCGGIRCVNALVRGDWGAAADHNVLLAVALPLAAVAWAVWFVRALQGRPLRRLRPPSWVWAAVVVVLVAYTVVRNVGWNTYWTDEFNTTTIDTTRWKPYANNYGAGNNELQCNLPDNAATANGALTITGRKQTVTCPGSGTYNYTSAFLGSRDTGTYYPLYGRYEIRARVPHGQGLWPGFWLRHRTGSSNAEVDILEMFHNQAPGTATQTLHFPNSIGTNTAKKATFFETPTPGTGDWHTFGVEIEPAGTNAVKFTFLIDNTPTHTYTNTNAGSWINTADPNATWDIAINMSVGGAWVGHPEEHLGYLPDKNLCGLTYRTPPAGPDSCPTTGLHLANLPATYQIDWVRVSTR